MSRDRRWSTARWRQPAMYVPREGAGHAGDEAERRVDVGVVESERDGQTQHVAQRRGRVDAIDEVILKQQ